MTTNPVFLYTKILKQLWRRLSVNSEQAAKRGCFKTVKGPGTMSKQQPDFEL